MLRARFAAAKAQTLGIRSGQRKTSWTTTAIDSARAVSKRGLSGQWIPALSSRRVSTAISFFLVRCVLFCSSIHPQLCPPIIAYALSAVSVVVGHSQYAAAVHEHAAIVSRGTCIQPMSTRASADSKDRHLGGFFNVFIPTAPVIAKPGALDVLGHMYSVDERPTGTLPWCTHTYLSSVQSVH